MADHGSQLRVYRSTSGNGKSVRISSGSVQIDQEPCRKSHHRLKNIWLMMPRSSERNLQSQRSSDRRFTFRVLSARRSGLGKHPRRNPTSTRQSHRDDRRLGSWGAARQDNFPFSSHEVTYARGPDSCPEPTGRIGRSTASLFNPKFFFFFSKGRLLAICTKHINR